MPYATIATPLEVSVACCLQSHINFVKHAASTWLFSMSSGLERLELPCMYLPHRKFHYCHSDAVQIANMLVAAKADDVCILDVSSQCSFTEHMVLATGRSHRHIQAAAAAVAYQVSLLSMFHITCCSHLCASATSVGCHCVTSSFTVGLLLAQMSLRCSEVAPGTRASVEGEDGSDWCVVDAGMLCLVSLMCLQEIDNLAVQRVPVHCVAW